MRKVVVITGGSEGLGKAIAQLLSPKYKVVILARGEKKLKAVAGELGCKFFTCDVTDSARIDRTVKKIIKEYGRIDCLVNNTGVFFEGLLENHKPEAVRKMIDINVIGTILMTRAVLPHVKKNKSGLIININSQAGLSAKSGRSLYNASKWAITGFTKCMQQELFSTGVRIAGIYPAMMKTEIFKKAGIDKNLKDAIEPQEVAKIIEFMLEQNEKVLTSQVDVLYNISH